MGSEAPTIYKCPKCNGLGVKDQQILEVCNFCHGRIDDLNWIENIFGVKPKPRRHSVDTMVAIHHFDDTGKPIIRLKVIKNRFKK